MPDGADADLRAEFVGVSPEHWDEDVGERSIALSPILLIRVDVVASAQEVLRLPTALLKGAREGDRR